MKYTIKDTMTTPAMLADAISTISFSFFDIGDGVGGVGVGGVGSGTGAGVGLGSSGFAVVGESHPDMLALFWFMLQVAPSRVTQFMIWPHIGGQQAA